MTPSDSRLIRPCAFCRAPDARGADHQRGCPKLAPVTPERLLAIAAACERGWQNAAGRRVAEAKRARAVALWRAA